MIYFQFSYKLLHLLQKIIIDITKTTSRVNAFIKLKAILKRCTKSFTPLTKLTTQKYLSKNVF